MERVATVACIHHLQRPFLGNVGEPLLDAGLTLTQHDLRAGDNLPSLDDVDGIVTLGGEQSVLDLGDYPYLDQEVALLREAVARELPVFGVCLGAQLLAHALGGTVTRSARRAVEWRELALTGAGAADPVFGALSEPVPALHWNQDVFTLPPGAVELLEHPADGVEAFRHGTAAWGVQFHPDPDPVALDGWYRDFATWLEETGTLEADARRADTEFAPRQVDLATGLFSRFARVVADRSRV